MNLLLWETLASGGNIVFDSAAVPHRRHRFSLARDGAEDKGSLGSCVFSPMRFVGTKGFYCTFNRILTDLVCIAETGAMTRVSICLASPVVVCCCPPHTYSGQGAGVDPATSRP